MTAPTTMKEMTSAESQSYATPPDEMPNKKTTLVEVSQHRTHPLHPRAKTYNPALYNTIPT